MYEDEFLEVFNEEEPTEEDMEAVSEEYDEDDSEFDEEIAAEANRIAVENSVAWYLKMIGGFPLLTREEEQLYAQLYDEGREAIKKKEEFLAEDQEHDEAYEAILNGYDKQILAGEAARQKLIESNLRLVFKIAKRQQTEGVQLMDLIQEGNIALMQAIERFDYRKGFKLSSYAIWWIRLAIKHAVHDESHLIHIPQYIDSAFKRVSSATSLIFAECGHEPNLAELAKQFNCPEKRMKEILFAVKDPTSLDNSVTEDDDTSMFDIYSDEETDSPFEYVANMMMRTQLLEVLSTLPEKEEAILKYRFGIDDNIIHTLDEVSSIYRLSRERIRQMEKKAIERMRTPRRERKIKDYYYS